MLLTLGQRGGSWCFHKKKGSYLGALQARGRKINFLCTREEQLPVCSTGEFSMKSARAGKSGKTPSTRKLNMSGKAQTGGKIKGAHDLTVNAYITVCRTRCQCMEAKLTETVSFMALAEFPTLKSETR